MFRKRNAHADAHSLMNELLETINDCLTSAEGEAAQLTRSSESSDTAVAFQQSEPATTLQLSKPGPSDDLQ
jgi:hypothetical protein